MGYSFLYKNGRGSDPHKCWTYKCWLYHAAESFLHFTVQLFKSLSLIHRQFTVSALNSGDKSSLLKR